VWMKKAISALQAAGFLAVLCAGAVISPDHARAQPSVSTIRFGVHADKIRLVLEASEKLPVTSFELGEPYRIVLDLPDIDWKVSAEEGDKGWGVVAGYRFGQFAPGRSRMVLDLKGPAVVDKAFHIAPTAKQPWRLVVDIKTMDGAAFAARLSKQEVPKGSAPARAAVLVPPPRPKAAGPQPRKIIVIDPGHGGIDPGAIGRKGVYEKRITLAMAQQLRRELTSRKRYQVLLTRDRDVFIRLRERVAMARAAGADLFISLHADSISNSKVRGASVYTLSENASDKEAADLAAKENKADLIAGIDLSGESSEVANILIDLAQRETMNHSASFARVLVDEMAETARFLRKSHRFAGFAVLKAPDVPSVLIEMGYLSNSRDEAQLSTAAYRQQLAEAIADAIDGYFRRRAQAAKP
jgi:N-acetylmuramoyl-L-alanine amidase